MSILRLGTRMYWTLELVRQDTWVGLRTGSGILSFMSAQAGAKQVIALEASSMADKMAVVRTCVSFGSHLLIFQLVRESNKSQKNPHMKNKIRIVKGMVEDEKVQAEVLRTGKVDTIISEPIGVMLFHERMVSVSHHWCRRRAESR
jgi:histone-arginine methyltransferase CARM1